VSSLLSHLIMVSDERRHWEVNPVLLKELRQAMRNSFLTGSLMFLLVSLFLVWLGILGRQNFLIAEQSETGLQAVRAFLTILTVISLFCIPLYTGIRFAAERMTPAGELMFATALPVWRIIRGKFLSAAYIQILFFSVFLPFLAVAGLLRGVDLPTIFFILLCLFIVVCVAVQAAVALACIPVPFVAKLVLGILFTAALAGSNWGIIALSFFMLQAGIATLMGTAVFWLIFVTFLLMTTAIYLILYGLSVAMAFDERHMRRHCRDMIEKGLLAPA
jgi:hypothetical protein